MLELRQIVKEYPAGTDKVAALKGIDLAFRNSEFVSILGPSGCGKTTMLNIIGGLDQYTTGDLVINNVSTKSYKDRDWDTYRNHSVGFVFQSYNLIPHQSVLQNVEIALSLSGVSRAERRKRAIQALERVGLGDQLKKKPGEMSGGQMQRVAIARAIVNDPDIILADEPTGALDSETSVQVMDILKEISKDRLVVMVTHNPELAEKYSTRIVTMLDGVIKSDSDPISENELAELRKSAEPKKVSGKGKRAKKPSMSFTTSFSLSLKNLFTKKGRTMLTSFAGSIGIIGIALIYAVSNGMTAYIDTVQEDTLSSYPLTLEAQHTDLGSLMESFINAAQASAEHDKDAVYQKPALYDFVNAMNNLETRENDLEAFKKYIETETAKDKEASAFKGAISGVQYTYNTDLLIYTENIDGTIILADTQEVIQSMLAKTMTGNMASMSATTSQSGTLMSMMEGGFRMWQEMLPGENGRLVSELLEKQYDVVYGTWPTEYNEIMLVLDENNELDDMTLFALGLKSEAEIDAIIDAAINKKQLNNTTSKWTYEEICNMEFRTILSSACYSLDENTGLYTDLRSTEAGLRYLYDNGLVLKVSGIIRPSEDAVSSMITGSIAYTSKLTEYVINNNNLSSAIKAQLSNTETDIFSGLPFKDNTSLSDERKAEDFKKHIATLTPEQKADAYVKIMSIPSAEQLNAAIAQALGSMTRADMEQSLLAGLVQQTGMSEDELKSYVEEMEDEELNVLFSNIIAEQFKAQYAAQIQQQMAAMSPEQLAAGLDMALLSYTTEQCAEYYEAVLIFSSSSYDGNMRKLGYVDINNPSAINLYAATFENKDVIEEAIATYNESLDEIERITYTDYVGLMMSSVTTIINAITYVLIAFVAVSLFVSSIMIGVVTLISVQERTKEIGILRAIGASKKNVSSMFNAETVIIGFTSGALGILITYLLCIPINLILNHVTGIPNLDAVLPVSVGIILVVISVLLTLIAGIIPSRSAAKKDPVVALRTE